LVAPEKSLKGTVGGVIGGVSGEANECEFSGLVNNGDITYVGTTQIANIYISGIIGKNSDTNGQKDFKVITNCTNNGTLSTSKDSKNTASILLSGITGRLEIAADVVCDKLVNNGALTHNGTVKSLTIGGVSSYSSKASFTNSKNTAAITIADGAKVDGAALFISGIASQGLTADKLENCSNSGKIYVGSKAIAGKKSTIAGLVTNKFTAGTISGCTNTGAIEIKDATFQSWLLAGGLFVGEDGTVVETFQNCSNSGNISIADNAGIT
jgi:hypothetical protein